MTLSGEQVLFNSAVFVGLGAAHIYARAARELYHAKEIETITRARKAFYGVVLARDVLEMMRQNLRKPRRTMQTCGCFPTGTGVGI